MNAAAFFAAAAVLPIATLQDVTRGGGLVVVAPHPDDESLGCGALIAAACAAGVPTRLVVLSDGTGSHPGSHLYPPMRLRGLREAETLDACAALGLLADMIRFMRLPDRFVPIGGPEAENARDAIVAAARACGAGAVCVTWGLDPHCDHAAAARLVQGARDHLGGARIFSYPIWGLTLPDEIEVGPAPSGLRFSVAPYGNEKRTAIAAHRSQTTNLIDDDPRGFCLTSEMIERITGPFELLLEEEPRRPSS